MRKEIIEIILEKKKKRVIIRITNEAFEGQLLSTLLTCSLCTAAQGEVADSRYF